MKTYIVTYHAPEGAMAATLNASPQALQQGMMAWRTWAQKCGNQLVDLGTPLIGSQKVLANGSSASSRSGICGYSIIKANSIDEAKNLVKDHPHLKMGSACEIEVHEAMALPF